MEDKAEVRQVAAASERVLHLDSMIAAGADNTPALAAILGPPVTLWRRFRDGEETRERLPRLLARWTQMAIPENEPNVERSRLEYNR